jgi:hypothetical protein
LQSGFGKAPLAFVPNLGQTNSQVSYLTRGPGFQLFLTANGGAVYSVARPGTSQGGTMHPSATRDVFRLDFAGASASPAVSGVDPLPSHSNYLVGNNPANWRRNVSQYDTVQYGNLYPGIDLLYHSQTAGNRQLEWDLVVQPGADSSVVRLNWQGLQSVSLDGRGNLLLRTAGGTLVEQAPVLYQQDAAGARHPVTGQYQLLGSNQVGFQIGAYDHTRPLVIDPLLGVAFSTYLGGSGDDFAYGIALDTQGNSYVVGSTTSANFPTGLGPQPPGTISQQVFVTKLNPQGNGILYTTLLGGVTHTGLGDGITAGTGIAIDGLGDVYVTGSTDETDFPSTHSFQTNWQGSSNVAFVASLDPTGALVYSNLLGSGNVHGRALALNATGVYVTGSVEAGGSADAFPTTSGAFQPQPRPGLHTTGFVTELNLTGATLTWSSYLGGSSGDSGNAIAVSASGVAYVSGSTASNDFPVTTGAYQTTPPGPGKTAAFVSSVASGGSSLTYSTYLHDTGLPSGNSAGSGLALNAADGSVYVVGSTDSSSFPTTAGAYQTTGSGVGDGFVTHLNASGTALLYSTYLVGGQAAGVAVDGQGYATVLGTAGTGLKIVGGPQTSFGGGDADAFLARLKPDGSSVTYAGFLGGNGRDEGNALALDAQGDAFVAGSTTSTNLVDSTGSTQLPYSGNFDAFVLEVLGSPWTLNGSYSVKPGSVLSVPPARGVLANAVSPSGKTLTVSQHIYNGPGSLTVNPDGSFTYTPPTGFSGTDSFSYVASDGTQTAAPTPVTITVGNPVSFQIYGTGQADNGTLLADGATEAHYQLLSAPETTDTAAPYVTMQNSFPFTPGYWVGDGPNSKWISPHANENDQGGGFSDALGDYTYRTTFDLSGYDPSTAVLIGQVSGDNTLKVLLNGQDTGYTSTNTTQYTSLHPLTITSGFVAGPNILDFVVTNTSPDLPPPDQRNPTGLRVEFSTATANPAPAAGNLSYSVLGSGTTMVSAANGLLQYNVSPPGLRVVPISQPGSGSLSLGADGSFTWTPGNTFTGQDSFTYQVQLGVWTSNVATVTLRSGPVVQDGSYTDQHDETLAPDATGGVLATASNASGQSMQAAVVLPPRHGALTLQPDGSFTYQPNPGYVGPDSFQFQATANGLTSNLGTIQVAVADQAPNPVPDAGYEVHAGQTLQVAAPGLGYLATDPDQTDTLTFVLDPGGPTHGTLTFAGDGSFSYQPAPGYLGTDTFRYHTNDGALNSPTSGTVTIQVTDQAPVAGNVSFDVQAGTGVHDTTRTVLSNSRDPDGDPMTAVLVSGPANATSFTLNPDGSFTYIPAAGTTSDSFTFLATDGWLNSAPATVTLQVSSGLIAHNHYYTWPSSGVLNISAADGVLRGLFNPNGHSVRVALQQGPGIGSVSVQPDGSFVFTGAGALPGAQFTQWVFQVIDNVTQLVVNATVTMIRNALTPTLIQQKMYSSDHGAARKIKQDDGARDYDPTWNADPPGQIALVPLVAGGPTEFEATFLLPSIPINGRDLVHDAYDGELGSLGIAGDLANWDPDRVEGVQPSFTLGAHTLTVNWRNVRSNAAGVPVPNVATVAGVAQHWQIKFPGAPGGDWISTIGTSAHTAYVLAGAPADGVTLYHTVVDTGTNAASGLATAANRDQIIARVKGVFGGDIRQIEGRSELLTYYGQWTVSVGVGSRTTATLLGTGDGNCQAWVDFFRDVLRSQGIGNTVITDYKMIPAIGRNTGLLFVKNWGVKPGGALRLVFPADGRGAVDFNNKQYRWIPGLSGVEKKPGVAGKGTPDPLAMFDSHVIIQIRVGAEAGVFDPSYGLGGATFVDYAVQAFDFAGRLAGQVGNGVAGVILTRVTRDNANTLIIRIP